MHEPVAEGARLAPTRARVALALGLVTLLGIGIRAAGLLEYALNPDEGVYYAIARVPEWNAFWDEVAVNAHPPLFYLLLRGLAAFDPDPRWLRLPALVFGCLAVPAFFLAVRPVGGARAGLVAALLAACAPGLVVQSQLLRPYTMQVALLAGGLALLLRYREERRPLHGVATALLLLGAVLTHYGSIVPIAALSAVALGGLALRRLRIADGVRLAAVVAPAGLAFVALNALHIQAYFERSRSPLWLGMQGLRVAYADSMQRDPAGLWTSLVGAHDYLFGPRLGALATLFFLAGVGVLAWRRRWAAAALCLGVVVLAATLGALERYPFGSTRHSLYLAIALIPTVAVAARDLLLRRPAVAAAAALAVALAAAFPTTLRAAIGAGPIRITPERVAPMRAVQEVARRLESLRDEAGSLAVLDKQTYSMLMPHLGWPYPEELRNEPETLGDTRVARIGWGRSHLLVSSQWLFGLDPAAWRSPHHLPGFLALADRTLPDLALRTRSDGLLVFGGWNAPHYRALASRDGEGERSSLAPWCVRDVRAHGTVGTARIDVARCLARDGESRE